MWHHQPGGSDHETGGWHGLDSKWPPTKVRENWALKSGVKVDHCEKWSQVDG